ncbi:MAG: HU family DNA-binding protein [Bacteroidaceae bacterium]|nr:HU family DNA-binding protein [Bacteroidaceae bacterium]
MGKISLSNIVDELVAKSGLARDVADNFIHAFVETIEKGLQEDNIVKIKGMGTFKLQEVSDRGSVDVNTGERITIRGHRKVTFTPDSAMKELVNRPFAHFEPTELNDGYPTENELDAVGAQTDETDEVSESTETTESVVGNETETAGPSPAIVEEVKLIVEEPIVEEPVAEEPIVEEPIVEEPVAEEPVAEEPVAEEPVAEEPVAEEPVAEEPVAEEPVVEEPAVEEPAVEEPTVEEPAVEEPVVEESVVEESIEPTEPVLNIADQPKQKKSKGCVWTIILILLLMVAAAFLCYFYFSDSEERSFNNADENGEMMVNPNLEEELGMGWDDEPEVDTQLPVEKKDSVVLHSEPVGVSSSDAGVAEPVVAKSSNHSAATAQPSTNPLFCSVTITPSLETKTIKDITPADTTDYVIEGTLVTHQLKSGETLIQLSTKYYGDKRLWPYIVKYNWMKDYNHVAIGQMVNIPILKDKPTE